jgi:hypothetical protein
VDEVVLDWFWCRASEFEDDFVAVDEMGASDQVKSEDAGDFEAWFQKRLSCELKKRYHRFREREIYTY